jgi:2-polyprenyl-6-methoxyphenol hydroxylase-like FAD-dependent oxidoreductase
VIVKDSAKTLLLSAIRVGDEHNPPVKPCGHHLDHGLLAELANRCYEHALAYATAGESADWLVFSDGFASWWREMLGEAADRVMPGLRTDIVKYLENQDLAQRTNPHDTRLFVRPSSRP